MGLPRSGDRGRVEGVDVAGFSDVEGENTLVYVSW